MKKLLSCLTSAPSICQNVIFLAKKVFLNVGPKLSNLGVFGLELKKDTALWLFYISTLTFFSNKIVSKKKIFKLGTNIVLIGYFGLEFQKTNVEFEISILEFVKKNLNLGPKIPYLGIFGLQFNKIYYQVFNQHTQIWETIKFYPNFYPSFKFETKHALFGSLAGMLKNYCDICNQRPPNCLIAKFRAKIRILKFGIKNALFGCFRPQF